MSAIRRDECGLCNEYVFVIVRTLADGRPFELKVNIEPVEVFTKRGNDPRYWRVVGYARHDLTCEGKDSGAGAQEVKQDTGDEDNDVEVGQERTIYDPEAK